jgi:hypothetical protein
MATNPPSYERPDIFITVAGTRLRLVVPADGWTFEEARIAKQVSGGMTPAGIEEGMWEQDPDAWLAVLRVSFVRAGIEEFPTNQISSMDLGQLTKDIRDAAREAAKTLPPAPVPGNSTAESSGDAASSSPATLP